MKLGELSVNRIGFGAMRVIDNGSIWGEPSDRAKALKVLRRAAELGVNFFDTAESYGPHTSEVLIAEALHPYPEGFVIGSKCGLARPRASRWDADGRPEKLKQDLEGSLKRLRLERIDLYQLHTVDPKVPLEVSLGALADMQREGKIRHIGLSNVTVRQLEHARRSEEHTSELQSPCNLVCRLLLEKKKKGSNIGATRCGCNGSLRERV